MSTIALAPAVTSPSRPQASRPQQPRLRLTPRGRAVVAAVLATPIAVVFAVSALSAAPAQAGVAPASTSFDYITVAEGESLWDLAGWIAPEADPREVVAALTSLNQLPSAAVQPGQRLAIPTAYAR